MNSVQNYFIDNYELSFSQALILPIFSVYSYRHFIKASTSKEWHGRIVHILTGLVEAIPVLGTIVSLVERYLALSRLNSYVDQKKSETSKSPSLTHKKITQNTLLATNEREAARIILTTPGFIADPTDMLGYHTTYGDRNEAQGTAKLRFVAADLTKKFIRALSPSVLKEEENVNPDQYLIFKIKRLSHVLSLIGKVTLPTGKIVNLEGFCEAFTIPMIASSFQDFCNDLGSDKSLGWLKKKETQDWIVQGFNKTATSDSITPNEINKISEQIQNPDFTGPISIGSGYNWHSTMIVFFSDYLFYCNRGYGTKLPGIQVFKLADRKLITPEIIRRLSKRQDNTLLEFFMEENIRTELGGSLIERYDMIKQHSGNCTYATAQAGLASFLVIRKILDYSQLFSTDYKDSYEFSLIWVRICRIINQVYDKWNVFDQQIVVEDFLTDIKKLTNSRELLKSNKNLYQSLLDNIVNNVDRSNLTWPIKQRLLEARKELSLV